MSTESRCVRAALAYAERFAFAVFPCSPRGKTPLTDHGFKDATKDPERIRRLWAAQLNGNVGIATGAISDIAVLDVDPRHFGDETLAALEAEHGRLPETPTVLTGGGGCHVYFHLPEGVEFRSSSGHIGLGLDVRGTGGYVVAPPSVHETGNLYYWEMLFRLDDVPLAEPTPWLLRLIQDPPVSRRASAEYHRSQSIPSRGVDLTRLVAGIPDGERDVELFRLACSLRRRGFSRPFVENAVLDAARRCRPPFPERTARSKVASAWGYGR
jgi:hypothetical protein